MRAEILTSLESNIDTFCNLQYEFKAEYQRQTYLVIIYNMLIHPDFNHVNKSVFNRIFIEMTAAMMMNKFHFLFQHHHYCKFIYMGCVCYCFHGMFCDVLHRTNSTSVLREKIITVIRTISRIDARDVAAFLGKFNKATKDPDIMDIGVNCIRLGIQWYSDHTYYKFIDHSLNCIIKSRKKAKYMIY